jgi:hypothetical protein
LFVTDPEFPFRTRIGFGFPFRLGWQMVSHLYRTGELSGDWGGNDQNNSVDWYMRGRTRTDCYPEYLMLGQLTHKEDGLPLPFEPDDQLYSLSHRIWDHGRLRMEIHSFDPLGEISQVQDLTEPAWYCTFVSTEAARQGSSPVAEVTGPRLDPPVAFSWSDAGKQTLADAIDPRIVGVDDRVDLVGYWVEDRWARPGGAVVVTLDWQVVKMVHLPVKVFVHLVGTEAVIQADDFPVCGSWEMSRWPIGELVADRHVLRLPADLPRGSYRLEVGVYEPGTNVRMDRLDVAGNPAGNSVELGSVEIQ